MQRVAVIRFGQFEDKDLHSCYFTQCIITHRMLCILKITLLKSAKLRLNQWLNVIDRRVFQPGIYHRNEIICTQTILNIVMPLTYQEINDWMLEKSGNEYFSCDSPQRGVKKIATKNSTFESKRIKYAHKKQQTNDSFKSNDLRIEPDCLVFNMLWWCCACHHSFPFAAPIESKKMSLAEFRLQCYVCKLILTRISIACALVLVCVGVNVLVHKTACLLVAEYLNQIQEIADELE